MTGGGGANQKFFPLAVDPPLDNVLPTTTRGGGANRHFQVIKVMFFPLTTGEAYPLKKVGQLAPPKIVGGAK